MLTESELLFKIHAKQVQLTNLIEQLAKLRAKQLAGLQSAEREGVVDE